MQQPTSVGRTSRVRAPTETSPESLLSLSLDLIQVQPFQIEHFQRRPLDFRLFPHPNMWFKDSLNNTYIYPVAQTRNIGIISDTFFPCHAHTDYQLDVSLLSPWYVLYVFTSASVHRHHVSSECRPSLPRQLTPLFPESPLLHMATRIILQWIKSDLVYKSLMAPRHI